MIVTVDYDTTVAVKIYSCVMGNCFINFNFCEWYNKWQRVTTNDNKLQRVTASDKTNENGTIHNEEWVIAIFLWLFQRKDGCN